MLHPNAGILLGNKEKRLLPARKAANVLALYMINNIIVYCFNAIFYIFVQHKIILICCSVFIFRRGHSRDLLEDISEARE